MSRPQRVCLALVLYGAYFASAQQSTQAGGATEASVAAAPKLTTTKVSARSRMSLDVLVTDGAGKPIGGLEPDDFTIFDNNQPRKVLAFRRTDGTAGNKVDAPVELIIVLDTVNMAYQGVTLMRLQVEKFLRQNDGHLAQPTSVFIFTSDGMRIQPQPTKDGNALATLIDQSTGTMRSMGTSAGRYGQLEQFSKSTQTVKTIAENEARKPGRKMLVWIGSGWPLLAGLFMPTNEAKEQYFASIIEMSHKLREARITVYSIYTLNGSLDKFLYGNFLKGVKTPKQADAGNLALQVLAVQTGGRILDSSNDVAGQIANCVGDVGTYYTLVFEAPSALQANEYHDLKVQVSQSGLMARTNTGYYNQP